MRINDITRQIIGAAMKVHTALGPGLLENAYRACLAHELRKAGLTRIDLLVEDCVVVELKSVEAILPVHQAQLISHMKLSNEQVGLLINFKVARLKDGIRRFVVGQGWSNVSLSSSASAA